MLGFLLGVILLAQMQVYGGALPEPVCSGNSGFSKTGPVPLEARVFNVCLLTQQPFVTDPSSAQFLISHGFDFNKQYSVGLPYCPPSARTKVRV